MMVAMTVTAAAPTALDEIERSLTVLIRRANLPRSHERMMSRAGVTLDKAGYSVLARLDDMGEARLGELAQIMGVDVSTMSRQVRDLEDAGLVGRSEHPGDRRVAVLGLTRAGHKVLTRFRDARREAIAEILAEWPPADRDHLARLLGLLVDDIIRYWETA